MAILVAVKPEVPSQEYLPLQEAARWYGVNPSTIYKLLSEGRLVRHKRDGDKRTYLRVEELEKRFRPRPVE